MGEKMTLVDETVARLRELPEPLLWEAYDFVTFLLTRYK